MSSYEHSNIKESLRSRALEVWGMEDGDFIDPVIDLLLDAFTHEFLRLEQSIKISDSKLLERISKILVPEIWSLPVPAHGLLYAMPEEDAVDLHRHTQFFIKKFVWDRESEDIFFTPLRTHKLINAFVEVLAFHNTLLLKNNCGQPIKTFQNSGGVQIPDYTVWVGININKELLEEQDGFRLSLTLNDSTLDAYLKMVAIYDFEGNELEMSPLETEDYPENEHYFKIVDRYYKNNFYHIQLPEKKEKYKPSTVLKKYFSSLDFTEVDENLFWLKLSFPVAFTRDELSRLHVSLNTFPVVNRKPNYKQHNVKKNGKIISLQSTDEFFLNVENLQDDEGRFYNPSITNDINNLQGSYALYFGDLEQFDERNAKAILEQVMQKVREEGSSFSAIGYDLLSTYLDDLNDKLNILERKISIDYKHVSNVNGRQYLLTIPFDNAEILECHYWVTNAITANGIPKGSVMTQFQINSIIPTTIRLQTETVGSIYRNTVKEKISSLRYGLISRDRIVSAEDVKEFIKMTIGKTVKRVDVKPGVGISLDRKQGLIRTSEVVIELVDPDLISTENKKSLCRYLKGELEHVSVLNIPYNVIIK